MYENISYRDASMYFNGVIAMPLDEGMQPGVVQVRESEYGYGYRLSSNAGTLRPSYFFEHYSVAVPQLGWMLGPNKVQFIQYQPRQSTKQGIDPNRLQTFNPIINSVSGFSLNCGPIPDAMLRYYVNAMNTDRYLSYLSTEQINTPVDRGVAIILSGDELSVRLNHNFALFRSNSESRAALFWRKEYVGELSSMQDLNINCPYARDQFNREMEVVNGSS